jgi:hypothetical protein
MADFADITEHLVPLVLPMQGKRYTIPPLPWDVSMRFAAGIDQATIDEMGAEEFQRTFLGDAYDQMVADNQPRIYVMRAALTALTEHTGGRQAAEAMWASGGDPLALEAWVASRKRAQPQDRKPSRSPNSASTAGATTTRKRASSRATTSRQK